MMGFFDKLKKGLAKTRETITNKIETLVLGYADINDDLLDELEEILKAIFNGAYNRNSHNW